MRLRIIHDARNNCFNVQKKLWGVFWVNVREEIYMRCRSHHSGSGWHDGRFFQSQREAEFFIEDLESSLKAGFRAKYRGRVVYEYEIKLNKRC
jgi:hypothetical protein